jgi:hypothetical protein
VSDGPNVEQIRADFEELRNSHENRAVREILLSSVAAGERIDSFLNWLMGASGAAVLLFLTQWSSIVEAMGNCAVAVMILLLIALIIGVVARFEIYQAQMTFNQWNAAPQKIAEAMVKFEPVSARYVAEVARREPDQQRVPEPLELRPKNIREEVERLLPPEFNTGWRKLPWNGMGWIAHCLTGSGHTEKSAGEFFVPATAAYRVASSLWLLVLMQLVLLVAALVGMAGLLWHLHGAWPGVAPCLPGLCVPV